MFDDYLKRWQLTVDGEPFDSLNGTLLPVRQQGRPAMLKISHVAEEQAGSLLMAWWQGEGAAPVLAHDGQALLMVRAHTGHAGEHHHRQRSAHRQMLHVVAAQAGGIQHADHHRHDHQPAADPEQAGEKAGDHAAGQQYRNQRQRQHQSRFSIR